MQETIVKQTVKWAFLSLGLIAFFTLINSFYIGRIYSIQADGQKRLAEVGVLHTRVELLKARLEAVDEKLEGRGDWMDNVVRRMESRMLDRWMKADTISIMKDLEKELQKHLPQFEMPQIQRVSEKVPVPGSPD